MYNKIMIIGNLGRDPEMRYTPSGDPVTNFSVATNRRYTRNGETVDETEWFNVSAWGRLAETTNQYLTRGKKVYVEGRLRSRMYTDRNGETRFSNDINAREVLFLDPAGQTSGGGGYPGAGDGPPRDDDVDDLPW